MFGFMGLASWAWPSAIGLLDLDACALTPESGFTVVVWTPGSGFGSRSMKPGDSPFVDLSFGTSLPASGRYAYVHILYSIIVIFSSFARVSIAPGFTDQLLSSQLPQLWLPKRSLFQNYHKLKYYELKLSK